MAIVVQMPGTDSPTDQSDQFDPTDQTDSIDQSGSPDQHHGSGH